MKLLRLLTEFTKLGHQGNTDVRERLRVQNLVEGTGLRDYQENKRDM
jgi:hypothetical protein